MKKQLLILIAALVCSLPLVAQDYAPFRMGYTPYFQAGDSVYSLRITNAYVQGNDSVFEFNPWVVPHQAGDTLTNCYGYSYPSHAYGVRTYNNLFGQKMIRNANSEYQFVFTTADTFLLKPNASIGESWTMRPGIMATLQSKTASLVQSMPDTVATITLSNGSSIQIGRKYGLISAVPFYTYIGSVNPVMSAQPILLRLLPEAGMGQAVASPFRIYDFQVGDKFQYFYTWGSYTSTCAEEWTTKEVVSRYDSPGNDTIRYVLQCQKLGFTYGSPNAPPQYCNGTSGSYLTGFYNDTLLITTATDTMIYSLGREYFPGSSISPTGWPQWLNSGMEAKDCNGYSRIHSNFILNMGEEDSCSGAFQFSDPDNSGFLSFAEGLGKVNNSVWGFTFHYITELSAYQKGSETCGTWKAMVLSVEEETIQNPLQIFPNPFTSEITLQLPGATSEPAEITVFNLQGQRVHQQKIADLPAQTGVKVLLPSLPAGLYLLQLNQGNKSYSVKVQKQ